MLNQVEIVVASEVSGYLTRVQIMRGVWANRSYLKPRMKSAGGGLVGAHLSEGLTRSREAVLALSALYLRGADVGCGLLGEKSPAGEKAVSEDDSKGRQPIAPGANLLSLGLGAWEVLDSRLLDAVSQPQGPDHQLEVKVEACGLQVEGPGQPAVQKLHSRGRIR